MLHIPGVLSTQEAAHICQALAGANWVDGRGTAGHLSAPVKQNQQLHWQDPLAIRMRGLIRLSLETGLGPSFDAAVALYLKRGFCRGEAFGEYAPSAFNQFFHLPL